jgi:hypothetical protein
VLPRKRIGGMTLMSKQTDRQSGSQPVVMGSSPILIAKRRTVSSRRSSMAFIHA